MINSLDEATIYPLLPRILHFEWCHQSFAGLFWFESQIYVSLTSKLNYSALLKLNSLDVATIYPLKVLISSFINNLPLKTNGKTVAEKKGKKGKKGKIDDDKTDDGKADALLYQSSAYVSTN